MGDIFIADTSTTDNFLRNRWNGGQTQQNLHVAETTLQWTSFLGLNPLPPRPELSIADTSSIILLFWPVEWSWVPWKCWDSKFVGICSPYSSLWLTFFQVAKMPKAQWDRDRNMDTIMEISVVHGQPLFYSENYEPKKQDSCPLRWLALSHVTNTRRPVAFKLSYKQDILYIVLRVFLLPTLIFWHALLSITLYPNTLE